VGSEYTDRLSHRQAGVQHLIPKVHLFTLELWIHTFTCGLNTEDPFEETGLDQ
jgi:hypothetical protein